jgi:predicted metal-binding membrane protein
MTRRFAMAMLALFIASSAVTIALCRSMDCGMVWMPMPPAAFLSMWIAMMVAMMLPSLAPILARRSNRMTFALGYFVVWMFCGAVAYAIGGALSVAASIVILIAGLVQLTPWKLRHLECCRACSDDGWRGGIRYGVHCALCCVTLISTLIVVGVMNLAAMAVITIAITVERLLPRPALVARSIGIVLIAAGLVKMA